jgi:protein-tyrosine phosphatase
VDAGVRNAHAPIFTDEEEYPDHLATAGEVYCWWLRERRNGVAGAMTAIADAPSAPILVHCHAGKDRTGVIVALVLRLAGVSIDDIADDYAVSGVQLADMLARDRVTAVERGVDPVRVERLFTVPREAMLKTMECVDKEHGGPVSLLRSIGLDNARIERLTNLLLSPTWP